MEQSQFLRELLALSPARIKAARLEVGLSQEGFARLIGAVAQVRGQAPSIWTVNRWERGRKSPGVLWGPALIQIVRDSEARRAHAQEERESGARALTQVGGD